MSYSAPTSNFIDQPIPFSIAAHRDRLNPTVSRFCAAPYSNNAPLEVVPLPPESLTLSEMLLIAWFANCVI